MAILFRIVARLLALMVLGGMRRRATATPGTVPPAGTSVPDAEALRRRIAAFHSGVVEGARITGHVISLAAFASFTAVLLTAGTTAASLGPRWFGIVCLVVAVPTGIAAAREFRVVWRIRRIQVRRRRAERLRSSSGL